MPAVMYGHLWALEWLKTGWGWGGARNSHAAATILFSVMKLRALTIQSSWKCWDWRGQGAGNGSTITGDEEVWEAEKEQAGPPCSCHLSSLWMALGRCWHRSGWQQTRLTKCLCPNMLQGTCEEMTVLQNFDVCEVSSWIAWFCSQLGSVVSSLLGWGGAGLHPEGFVLSCYFKSSFAKEMLRAENRVFQHTQVEDGISNWAHWAIFAHDSSVKTRQFYPRTAKKKSATTWQVHFWCRSQFFPSWPIGLSVSISCTLWKINPAACSLCVVLFFSSDSITGDSQR